ncbi:MAG: hypothetical protein Q8M79_02470 [Dehalococcoidia bacterium]|nr:hypothetical protein [Dehalococcoidia bacterium]
MSHLRLVALVACATLVLGCRADPPPSPPAATPPATMAQATPIAEVVVLPPIAERIVDAVASDDAERLWVLVQTQQRACTNEGMDALPCPPDTTPGTVLEVFPTASCQGYWAIDPRDIIDAAVASAGALYAVARIGPDPEWATEIDYPYGTLVVVFAPPADARMTDAVAIYATEEAVVRTQIGCRRPDQFLEPGVGEAALTVLWRTDAPERTR